MQTNVRKNREKVLYLEVENLVFNDKIISIWYQGNLLRWTLLRGKSSKKIALGQISNPDWIVIKEEIK